MPLADGVLSLGKAGGGDLTFYELDGSHHSDPVRGGDEAVAVDDSSAAGYGLRVRADGRGEAEEAGENRPMEVLRSNGLTAYAARGRRR